MKNRFSLSGILMAGTVLVAVFFSSCGSKNLGYKGVIPTDAPVVLEINMEKLTLKSNILSYKDQLADIIVESEDANETALKVAEALRKMDDGGLNFHNPVYVFTTANVDGAFLLASVRSKEEVAKTVLNLGEGKYRVVEDEGDGLSWIENDDHTPIGVFNDETFLVGTTEQKELFGELMQSDGDFFGSRMGEALSNHAGDITLMLNAQSINEDIMDMIRMRVMQSMRDKRELFDNEEVWSALCKMQVVMNLTSSVGELSLNIYNVSEESTPQFLTQVSPDVFKKIPAEGTIGVLAMGLNGEKMSEYLAAEMEKGGAAMDNETRMGLMLISSFIKSMNGTAAVSIAMDPTMTTPSFVGLLPIAKERSQYLFNMLTENLDLKLYLTGDNQYSAISNQRTYQYGNAYPSIDLASQANSCLLYGFLDINKLLQMAIEEDSKFPSRNRGTKDEAIINYVQMFDYMEMKMMAYDGISLILKMKDKEHQSLDVLLKSTFELGLNYLQTRREREKFYNGLDDDYVYLEYLGDEDMFEDAEWEELGTVNLEEVEW